MKISDKQAQMLWDIAKSTLSMIGGDFPFDREARMKLVSEILNQQDDKPKNLE